MPRRPRLRTVPRSGCRPGSSRSGSPARKPWTPRTGRTQNPAGCATQRGRLDRPALGHQERLVPELVRHGEHVARPRVRVLGRPGSAACPEGPPGPDDHEKRFRRHLLQFRGRGEVRLPEPAARTDTDAAARHSCTGDADKVHGSTVPPARSVVSPGSSTRPGRAVCSTDRLRPEPLPDGRKRDEDACDLKSRTLSRRVAAPGTMSRAASGSGICTQPRSWECCWSG